MDYSKLPKVELHLHLNGACRTETLRDLARQYHLNYPYDDPVEFEKHVVLLTPASSLTDFLKVFTALKDILRTKDALERVSYEYCETLKNQNTLYFECRYNPMSPFLDAEQHIQGVIAGLQKGERVFGVKSRHILVFKREEPENVTRIVDLALKYKDHGVVGVDMAGDELLPLDQRHIDGFRRAKANGLHITVHAGESGPASNVRQAIEVLGADRIGHGYHVVDDEAIYQMAQGKKVHFEGCPTSSTFTNSQAYESHAMKRWARDGTSFSISTDDPGVMKIDLQGEFVAASVRMGISRDAVVKSILDVAAAAFLPDPEKQVLLGQVKQEITQWEQSIH